MTPARPAAPAAAAAPARYTRTAIALHWLMALALVAQIGFGFAVDEIAPRATPARAAVINLHKSFGLVLLALVVLRLGWRWRHPPPPWPPAMPPAQRRLALLGHRALYAAMLVLPMSGAVASNVSRHGIVWFGLRLPPLGPDLPQVYRLFNGVHEVTAWVLTALIAGHVLAAAHHALRRDGVFRRIWPAAASEPTA